jgi:hypothetical protein
MVLLSWRLTPVWNNGRSMGGKVQTMLMAFSKDGDSNRYDNEPLNQIQQCKDQFLGLLLNI